MVTEVGFQIRIHDYQRLTEQRSVLRAADIEQICKRGQILQRDIISGIRQRRGQSGAVQEQIEMVQAAQMAQLFQFLFCILCSQLSCVR